MPRAAKKTTTKNVVAMRRPALTNAANPSITDIAQRAFELYCARGCHDGYDVQDWLQAEQELATAKSTAA